jgi:hypothetical protein
MSGRWSVLVLAAACGGCVGGGIPRDVVNLARATKPGGNFYVEFDESGSVISADSEIAIEMVPFNCRAAADAAHPGGRVIGAEHEYAGGKLVWEVIKEIDGREFEILVSNEGAVIGGEEVLPTTLWPNAAVEAAKAAVPGGTVERVERVWGPESTGGEAFHIKMMKDGDSLRVGCGENGRVVRIVRRVNGQVRVPK